MLMTTMAPITTMAATTTRATLLVMTVPFVGGTLLGSMSRGSKLQSSCQSHRRACVALAARDRGAGDVKENSFPGRALPLVGWDAYPASGRGLRVASSLHTRSASAWHDRGNDLHGFSPPQRIRCSQRVRHPGRS